ncbi:alpha/beta fold hydrolase [Palleronia pelagia]|uniref:Pimeloyl-ACP methyl ester carboxylesterase n=1 Tax=Palleronia pelagia TaxID=387096 RepID=A0A1H8BVV5_9RHOB|nr:alpha/beta fold hydrolase [Palleronia pelagia]SEM86709.1 Pimeloyl-ACP methyl ester carboxylesterase [Palleronia pelagia]
MPFTDHFVTVEGRPVAYVDEGPRDAAPVVLLHGGGFDHAELTWRITTADLRDRFRLVVPDIPGYGRSPGFDGPHDLPRLGGWLVAFLDAMGIAQADVCGVSMGGGMALWLALEHPDRVRRLVPVGSYGIMPRVPMHLLAHGILRTRLTWLIYNGAGRSRVLARAGLAASYGRRQRVTERAVDELMDVARDQGRRRSFDAFLAAEMDSAGLKSDLTPRLGEIAKPVLLVHGSEDRVVPVRHARRAAARIPDARYLELATGHWPMRERPDLFNPALADFLASP